MSFSMPSRMGERYSPLYFLASLGAGGLAVTFFMYLMFWVPHPDQPVPVFETIAAQFQTGSMYFQTMIVLAVLGIAFFAILHYRLLLWNIGQLRVYMRTEAYQKLRRSNAETQLKAVPLTLAMSVNVGFILGLVFVPGLWSVVEYLFPFAILAFVAIGFYALKLLSGFFGRVLTRGGFDLMTNNSFAQLLPSFALSMVAVGLAAPAAMSNNMAVVAASFALSTFFMIAAVTVAVVALVLGFHSMMQHGTAPEAAPTLMIVIPIMTVIGIALIRMNHGLHTQFDVHTVAADNFVMFTRIVALQVLFGLLGMLVLRRQRYFDTYLKSGSAPSAGAYALVCPGVALSVMLHFWVNKGLVASGVIAKFSTAYWALTMPALFFQVLMIVLVFRLHRINFSQGSDRDVLVPAE